MERENVSLYKLVRHFVNKQLATIEDVLKLKKLPKYIINDLKTNYFYDNLYCEECLDFREEENNYKS